MDWLLKHPILIFAIVMVVSSLLKKLKSPEEASSSSDGRQSQDASDDGERTRRLQEEIRRKIAERRGQLVPPPLVPVPEPEASVWDEKEKEPWSYRKEEALAVEEAPGIDPILERQRALAEQLAALQLRHATVSKASQAAWAPELPTPASASTNFQEVNWLRELRSARSLRKAIILREVIGPPVALR